MWNLKKYLSEGHKKLNVWIKKLNMKKSLKKWKIESKIYKTNWKRKRKKDKSHRGKFRNFKEKKKKRVFRWEWRTLSKTNKKFKASENWLKIVILKWNPQYINWRKKLEMKFLIKILTMKIKKKKIPKMSRSWPLIYR